ncbi:MAG: hypothetical protein ACRDTT_16375 [Pseudonocardiaceae bacterium]
MRKYKTRILDHRSVFVTYHTVVADSCADAAERAIDWFLSAECDIPAPMTGAPYWSQARSPAGYWL